MSKKTPSNSQADDPHMSSVNSLTEYPQHSENLYKESKTTGGGSTTSSLKNERPRQLKDTLDSLAAIVNRLEAEVQMLRTDRKQLSQRLESLVQENEALKENRSSTVRLQTYAAS
jgi:septal ring factor EnvC (AmiA/AmiB activator)